MAALRRRHELRAVLKNYDRPRRFLVVVDLAAGSVVEAVLAFLRGDRARARRVGDAWLWNWRHRKSAQGRSQGPRACPSAARPRGRCGCRAAAAGAPPSRRGQPAAGWACGGHLSGPSARRWRPCSGPRTTRSSDRGLRGAGTPRCGPRTRAGPWRAWSWWSSSASATFSPAISPSWASSLPFPGPPVLLREFFGGWQDAGWQATGPAPPAFGLVGAGRRGARRQHRPGGEAALAGTDIRRRARHVPAPATARLEAGPAHRHDRLSRPAARVERHRGGRPPGSRHLRRHALRHVAYLPRDAGWPRSLAADEPSGWRGVSADVVPFGLLLAAHGGALAPPSVLAVAAWSPRHAARDSLVAGTPGAILRALGVTAGALVVAFLCLFPWSLTFLQSGARWSILAGAVGSHRTPRAACFGCFVSTSGPIGAGWLGWGILLGAAFVLLRRPRGPTRLGHTLVGRGPRRRCPRLRRVGRDGSARVGVPPWSCSPRPRAAWPARSASASPLSRSTSPGAVSAGARTSAPRRRLCLVGRPVPVARVVCGRAVLPSVGRLRADPRLDRRPGRRRRDTRCSGWVIRRACPRPSWQVRRGLAFAVSTDGLPDGRRLWPSANPGVGAGVETALTRAEVRAHGPSRLGAGPRGHPLRGHAEQPRPRPSRGAGSRRRCRPRHGLVQALQAQSDLRQLPTEGGVIAFENVAWPAAGAAAETRSSRSGRPQRRDVVELEGARAGWRPAGRRARDRRGLRPAPETSPPRAFPPSRHPTMSRAARTRRLSRPQNQLRAHRREQACASLWRGTSGVLDTRGRSLVGVGLGVALLVSLNGLVHHGGAGGQFVGAPSLPVVRLDRPSAWRCPGPLPVGAGPQRSRVAVVNTSSSATAVTVTVTRTQAPGPGRRHRGVGLDLAREARRASQRPWWRCPQRGRRASRRYRSTATGPGSVSPSS